MSKMVKAISLLVFVSCTNNIGSAQQNWSDISTVEEVCNAYPTQMENMLNQFNLDYPGLEKVASAKHSGNLAMACHALLDYFMFFIDFGNDGFISERFGCKFF